MSTCKEIADSHLRQLNRWDRRFLRWFEVFRLHWRLKIQKHLPKFPKRVKKEKADPNLERKKFLQSIPTLNVIIRNEHFRQEDAQIFFFEDDDVSFLPRTTDMADIGFLLGMFQSKGQARKNGWSGPIPLGWTDRRGLGKLKNNLFIWNPIPAKDDNES